MKKNIMQNMASIYKKFKFVLLCSFFSLSLFGCMTSSKNDEDQLNQAQNQKVEELVNKESADFVEGLVPPSNQNILLPYYVQAGDNLGKISKKIYGDLKSWKKIAEINKIVDANKIYAGDVIYYQLDDKTKMFAEKYENAPRAKIIVKKGDTLSHISKAVFGRSKDWRVLWKENPQIANPDRIKEGTAVYFRPKALTADAGGYNIINKESESQPVKNINLNEDTKISNEEPIKQDLNAINDQNNTEQKAIDVKQDASKNELTEEEKNAIRKSSESNFVNPDDIPKNPKDD
ncbi:LysM peptidoglycan-binding domain-containing protein [Silvanigrella paludirubra]|uniref:LysM peptidoglycan-binding domain-containing protein n=1 Tax=Silvanigrella paludirubra TaxID=2499159 RepID=A0A6N6VXU2_9BACT|nr:LysM peptidoglycan-binding domain-containing protein [Silvanigrella paludirubra]KAB8038885.1 LysM peptidoglycan-binding domain-containing protein [Silvanigrella paludirubra]